MLNNNDGLDKTNEYTLEFIQVIKLSGRYYRN